METLKNTYFRDFQTRDTNRTIFNILNTDENIIAEIDMDDVEYKDSAGNSFARICFIEIELKDFIDNKYFIDSIVEDLKREYGDTMIRYWPYGKVTTGKAITDLLKDTNIKIYFTDGYLKCNAINQIENYIMMKK